jgi:hypothetical protein
MIQNRRRLLTREYRTNAKYAHFFRHALVLQMMMVVGLFSLTSAILNTVPVPAHAAPPDAIIATLENARRDLEINTALADRIADNLEQLQRTGQTPCEVITDYEAYLARVRAMVAENRQLVEQLERLHLQRARTTSSQQASEAEALQAIIDAPIPEAEVTGEVTALDRELNASLSEFDDMLLEELKLIREKSSPKIDALAQEAAEAAERLRERGIDIDANPSEMESDSQEESENPATGTASGAADRTGDSDSPATTTGQAADGVEGDRQNQTDRYDGSDDDIVARQLREAAEQETDPVLKEKLWQEYEAYKRGGT